MNNTIIYWVGRFQFHALCNEVIDIYDKLSATGKVNIVVSLSPLKCTKNNPFNFQTRKAVLTLASLANKNRNVYYINNKPSDKEWSKELDRLISTTSNKEDNIIVVGRQSTVGVAYNGKHKFQPIDEEHITSYQKEVNDILKSPPIHDVNFRLGILFAQQEKYDTAFTCVDVAIFNEDNTKILLGYKNIDKVDDTVFYRFIGGFSDPTTKTFEQDVAREAYEETGVEIGDIKYVASFLADDWRYREERDKIKTLLFTAKYVFGAIIPSDDIDGLKWFDIKSLTEDMLVPNHRPLLKALNLQ